MPGCQVAARFPIWSAVVSLALVGCMSASDADLGSSDLVVTSHCTVAGAGTIASGAWFDGDIHDVGGVPMGSWDHDIASDALLGTPSTLVCRINGSRIADATGTGTWNGVPGYQYTLHVQDRGDPTIVSRVPGAPEAHTVVASRTYSPSVWTDGTLSFAAGALVAVPAALPVTVGNAGNQWTRLTFVDHDTGEPTRCSYRGGASTANPTGTADIARGLSYAWQRCETCTYDARGACVFETDPAIVVGTVLDVDSMELHVQHGSSRFPSCDDARTTVSLDLSATPFVMRSPDPDYYRLLVFDAAGTLVHFSDGDLVSGDLRIAQLP
jgi:hypothetical protein